MKLSKILLILFFSVFIFCSCDKEEPLLDNSVRLEFSTDSVLFDTVFSTVGSITKQIRVYNKYSSPIIISSLFLGKNTSSFFTLNVDGIPGKVLSDIEIPANDSIFIFVKVTVDPTQQNNPLVINDSIVFVINGNTQSLPLIAWGQDAYYHTPKDFINGLPPLHILTENETWKSDKPHLIYGYAVVDSNFTLTIEAGARLHFHHGSGLWIYRGGKISAKGTKELPIVFQGDRLEWTYREKPNQWDRIWINDGAEDNVFDWCIIKNSFIGIQAEPLPFAISQSVSPNKLKISNSIISHCGLAGILARNHNIEGYNLLIHSCGQHNLAILFGGEYNFTHCTFANYWSYNSRKTPLLLINNYYEDENYQVFPFDLHKASFTNCIFYGNGENEFSAEIKGAGASNYLFSNSLLKLDPSTDITDPIHWISCIKNDDPSFIDVTLNDYQLKETSIARDFGKPEAAINPLDIDLNGNSRTIDGKPDAGCFEYVPR